MLKKVIQFLLNLLKEVEKNNPPVVEEVKKKEEIIKEVMILKKGSQGEEVKKLHLISQYLKNTYQKLYIIKLQILLKTSI